MRKYVGTALYVAVVAALFWSTGMAADTEKKPLIFIEEMRHDMGNVFEAKNYKHTFTVKNNGNADLEIKSVKPG
jgi:hypothetical protein